MSWETHEAAKRIADGWYAELEDTRKRNAVLGRENAKLRKLVANMANALGINREWCDTSWCDTDCMIEFGCKPVYCGGETRCPAWKRLHELGVEVEKSDVSAGLRVEDAERTQ